MNPLRPEIPTQSVFSVHTWVFDRTFAKRRRVGMKVRITRKTFQLTIMKSVNIRVAMITWSEQFRMYCSCLLCCLISFMRQASILNCICPGQWESGENPFVSFKTSSWEERKLRTLCRRLRWCDIEKTPSNHCNYWLSGAGERWARAYLTKISAGHAD